MSQQVSTGWHVTYCHWCHLCPCQHATTGEYRLANHYTQQWIVQKQQGAFITCLWGWNQNTHIAIIIHINENNNGEAMIIAITMIEMTPTVLKTLLLSNFVNFKFGRDIILSNFDCKPKCLIYGHTLSVNTACISRKHSEPGPSHNLDIL